MNPPKWAERFLRWYCNPDLLEEIEGDVSELFYQRLEDQSEKTARLKYVWDVLRFFRWTNIRRTSWYGSEGTWRYHFRLAFRNTNNHPFHSLLKMIGIAISFGYALTLFLFAFDELSYDKSFPDAERIFRIGSKAYLKGNTTEYAVSPFPLAAALKDRLPEVEKSTRCIADEYPVFKKGDFFFSDLRVLSVDSNYLDIFQYEFLVGSKVSFNEPGKLILSQRQAERMFGDKNPIGETLLFHNSSWLEVVGVLKENPHLSHLKVHALISWSTFDLNDDWNNLNAYSYILLKKNTSIKQVGEKILPALSDYTKLIAEEYGARYEPIIQNIADIHLSPPLDEDIAIKGSKTMAYMLLVIGMLFSLLGIVTYVNLVSAEVTKDSKKAGLLTIFCGNISAYRRAMLTESFLNLTMAALFSASIVVANLYLAKHYLGTEPDFSLLTNSFVIGLLLGYFAIVFIAVYVSVTVYLRLNNVVNVLKGKLVVQKAALSLRNFFVSLQFSFSIVMVALIIVLVQQFNYLQSKDRGFRDENVLVLKLHSRSAESTSVLKTELMKQAGIISVAGSSYYPEIIETKYVFNVETSRGVEKRLVPLIRCNSDYLKLIGVTFKAGRNLDDASVDDFSSSYIVNEAAAKEFGWNDAIGRKIIGPVGANDNGDHEGAVVGLVHDFNFSSLYNRIDPLIIILGDGFRYLYLKLEGNHLHETIGRIQNTYTKLFPEDPFEWEFLDSKYKSLYERDYNAQIIFRIGTIISFIISCLGIFSISSLIANLRQKESGIRKIVGASSWQLVGLHIRRFSILLMMSLLIACPTIYVLSNYWLNSFAYRIEPGVLHYLIPAALAAITIALIVGYHGVKSTRVNPVDILKYE